jgi:archaellin
MTACDGTSSATNKCAISLTTPASYVSNVKWSSQFIGPSSGSLLKPGGQCQITIDTTDLGVGKTLSDSITANSVFIIQIRPQLGAAITVQRTLPGAISGVMDLN